MFQNRNAGNRKLVKQNGCSKALNSTSTIAGE